MIVWICYAAVHLSYDHNSASPRETPIVLHANNKGADQPALPRRLFSTFVIRFIGKFQHSSESLQLSRLCTALHGRNLKTGFLAARLIHIYPSALALAKKKVTM